MVTPTDFRLEIDVSEPTCKKWKKELILMTDSAAMQLHVHADYISRLYQQVNINMTLHNITFLNLNLVFLIIWVDRI
jgi:hypothetical protein